MSLGPGYRLAHYRILGSIGKGGMGEVYRAQDTKLGREVAVKVLPEAMAEDRGRLARFQREARAVAALNHPNIVTIHSVEEADGVHFLTMELAQGKPLDELLPEEGFPLDRLLAIAAPIADAVACAHAQNIVHRDLKPANVVVDEDTARVKVLDFGVAKLTGSTGSGDAIAEEATLSRTDAGMIIGTVHYMSPEQARGASVDARSDVFSLGVMLYQMATGRRPFEGASAAELLSSILRDTPSPASAVKPGLPASLDRLIGKCLAKAHSDRYPSARDVYEALKGLRADAPAAPAGAKSIAVLPFVNRSGKEEDEYFSDGLSDELISALGKLPGIRVAARSSSFQFRGKEWDVREVGKKLGVETILEGSVRIAGQRLRITTELVSSADGYQLWSERYDRRMEDVFDTQDEIVRDVVDALKVQLEVGGPATAGERPTQNVDAYQLYLKGRHLRYTRLDWTGALESFQRAARLDPAFAAARAAAAEVHAFLAVYEILPPKEAVSRAREELSRAVELGGETALQLGVEGILKLHFDWDTREATRLLRRSIELDPAYISAGAWYAWVLAAQGRPEEARREIDRMKEFDPLSPYVCAMSAWVHVFLGQLEEAESASYRALEIEPGSILAMWMRGVVLGSAEKWDDALLCFEQAAAISGRGAFHLGQLAWAQAASGREREARETLLELSALAAERHVSPLVSVWALAELGDMEAARDKLRESFSARSPMLIYYNLALHRKIRHEPIFDALARHLEAADGTGFDHEAFDA